ncbi:hypothetical protein EOL96_04315 [Candidatus Saccharibacteria bacterium]|nr:hypothetical protein [Candidatus Saccharibacteria bacterium]
MSVFLFDNYNFSDNVATFTYKFEDITFTERIVFRDIALEYNSEVLERALFLAFVVIGTSYYKCFPVVKVQFADAAIDTWQAEFFNRIYQEGLGQFAYENDLRRADLATFCATNEHNVQNVAYHGAGDIVMQSGGKDSLLLAALYEKTKKPFTAWYCTSSAQYPQVLDSLSADLVICERQIDHRSLNIARSRGALNGHVPVTYIHASLAIVHAILRGASRVVLAVGHEGEEAHTSVGDLAVLHQWSKTWRAEQMLAEYVRHYISSGILLFSPLRRYSELRIAELFAEEAWAQYATRFSSCNLGNYMQGYDNRTLVWCGKCPKCVNSYLLFAPFVNPDELRSLFGGRELFADASLTETFKGLFGIDDIMKPFECVGGIDELRQAYYMAQHTGSYASLPFDVPKSVFDYKKEYQSSGERIDE